MTQHPAWEAMTHPPEPPDVPDWKRELNSDALLLRGLLRKLAEILAERDKP